MRNRATLIEALERYRRKFLKQAKAERYFSERVLMAWVFHDNLLEGRTFRPEEIQIALRHQDQQLPSYLRPLLEDVRRYEQAIEMTCVWAQEGQASFNLSNLQELHRHLMFHEPQEGARLRRNSPVHRDYQQVICSHRQISTRLQQFFTEALNFNIQTDDVLSYAAHLHHQLMYIYPYRRQPGALARLFTNQFLIMHGYPPIILASHERGTYYEALATHDCASLAQLFYQAAWRYLDSIDSEQAVKKKLSFSTPHQQAQIG